MNVCADRGFRRRYPVPAPGRIFLIYPGHYTLDALPAIPLGEFYRASLNALRINRWRCKCLHDRKNIPCFSHIMHTNDPRAFLRGKQG